MSRKINVVILAMILSLLVAIFGLGTQLSEARKENAQLRAEIGWLRSGNVVFRDNVIQKGERAIVIEGRTYEVRSWNRSDDASGVTHSTVFEPCDFDKDGKLIENGKCRLVKEGVR